MTRRTTNHRGVIDQKTFFPRIFLLGPKIGSFPKENPCWRNAKHSPLLEVSEEVFSSTRPVVIIMAEVQLADASGQELAKLKANHDEAFLYIASGIEHEENGNADYAREAYLRGLQKLEIALAIRCDRPHCTGPKWETARKMQHKMRRTLNEMQGRLAGLVSQSNGLDAEQPPSYDEACSLSNRRPSLPLLCFGEPNGDSVSAEEIFTVPDGVQVFFVTGDGVVSTLSEPSPLAIFKFTNVKTPTSPTTQPPAWLQIGSWSFPLLPGQSPVLHSGFGAYLFPDVLAQQQGSAVGIILPSTLEPSTITLFEQYMMELTELKVEDQVVLEDEDKQQERTSHRISGAIVSGAQYISSGIAVGAEATGKLVQLGASKLKERLTPDNPVPVDPRLKRGISFLRGASGVVRNVSGFAVKKLGEATLALGRALAPQVQKSGIHLLGATGIAKDSVDSRRKMDDVMIVAAAGLQGFSTIYVSLEHAAKNLASCLGSETVRVVDHKYGSEASDAVNNAVCSVGNLALTFHNVHSLGVKSIAKRTAADTGRAVLSKYAHQK